MSNPSRDTAYSAHGNLILQFFLIMLLFPELVIVNSVQNSLQLWSNYRLLACKTDNTESTACRTYLNLHRTLLEIKLVIIIGFSDLGCQILVAPSITTNLLLVQGFPH